MAPWLLSLSRFVPSPKLFVGVPLLKITLSRYAEMLNHAEFLKKC